MKVNTPTIPPNDNLWTPSPFIWYDEDYVNFEDEELLDDDFDYIEEINPEYEPDIEDDQI